MELCSELRHYYEPAGAGSRFEMVRHPLVFSVPYMDHPEENERLNKMLGLKQEARLEARNKKTWHSYVFLHERPYRIDALMSIIDMVKKKDRWELIREVFIDTENLADNLDDWRELLVEAIGKDVWRTKKDLPASIQVYRGGYPDKGVSWTLNLEKAKWFANRLGRNLPVFSGIVDKKNAIGYLTERGEEEIVVFHEHVSEITKITGL